MSVEPPKPPITDGTTSTAVVNGTGTTSYLTISSVPKVETPPPSASKPSPFSVEDAKSKETVTEFAKHAAELGYVKKKAWYEWLWERLTINKNTKKAIVIYLSVNVIAISAFVKSGVSGIDATNWAFSPFAWMTLMIALISTLPILFGAWRDNGDTAITPSTTI